jgi:hypothetical protein
MARRPARGPSFAIAEVMPGRSPVLRAAPGGPPISVLGDRTEFGSLHALGVVRMRRGWLGVQSPLLANGEVGWIRRDPARLRLYWTKYSLFVDRSRRRLEVRYGRRAIREATVTVGAPGSETPPGRFAVTDALRFEDSPFYGCCALALSGRQPRLPIGWLGGDRIAIHGTPGLVGGADSLGCIRAGDEVMRYLLARIPLGAPVFVTS